jgi:hypothetical protein
MLGRFDLVHVDGEHRRAGGNRDPFVGGAGERRRRYTFPAPRVSEHLTRSTFGIPFYRDIEPDTARRLTGILIGAASR